MEKDRVVILTDDGAATGETMIATLQDMKTAKAKKTIVALPVCPPDTAKALSRFCSELVILAQPLPFLAVGQWYLEFPQLSDEEVIDLLAS